MTSLLSRLRWARWAGSAVAAGLLATAIAAASCDVGDAICTDDTVEEDRDDNCPYGPPGGPQRTKAEGCEYTLSDENCTVTFRDDIYPILTTSYIGEPSAGGCTLAACHGPMGTGSIDLVLPEAPTPEVLYAALSEMRGDNGAPYIEEGATNAYFLCNVLGKLGGGSAMPPTAGLTDDPSTDQDDTHIAVIEEWVRCGMKLDSSEGGGGAGGGGEGGEGGGDAGGGDVGGAGGGI